MHSWTLPAENHPTNFRCIHKQTQPDGQTQPENASWVVDYCLRDHGAQNNPSRSHQRHTKTAAILIAVYIDTYLASTTPSTTPTFAFLDDAEAGDVGGAKFDFKTGQERSCRPLWGKFLLPLRAHARKRLIWCACLSPFWWFSGHKLFLPPLETHGIQDVDKNHNGAIDELELSKLFKMLQIPLLDQVEDVRTLFIIMDTLKTGKLEKDS